MPTRRLTRIFPHLWYIKEAEEAARFYTSIFPKSRIDRVWSLNDGAVGCVEFRLFGQQFFAMSAGEQRWTGTDRLDCVPANHPPG